MKTTDKTRKASRREGLEERLRPLGFALAYERGTMYPRGAWAVGTTINGVPFHAEADTLDGVQTIADRLSILTASTATKEVTR